MKILQANSGVLTNFDVLNFLESRGASKQDQKRVLANVAPSEFKVYDYLVENPACTQTRENIDEFKEKCRKYDLAEGEVLNIINTRPSSIVGLYPLIENCDLRLGDDAQELVDMIVEVFPLPPAGTVEDAAKTTEVEQTEDQNDNDEEKSDEEPIETTDGS